MSATDSSSPAVTEPFPIYKLAHRYLVYDVNVASHIRREHNICGVLIGTLPQASQQNVFLGLPLELMPEDARLLVEKGAAHVVDDVAAHKRAFLPGPPGGNRGAEQVGSAAGLSAPERKAFQNALRRQGQAAAQDALDKSEDRKAAALKKQAVAAGAGATENWNDIPDDMLLPSARSSKGPRKTSRRREPGATLAAPTKTTNETNEDYLLFTPSDSIEPPAAPAIHLDPSDRSASPVDHLPQSSPLTAATITTAIDPTPYAITPTTSYPPLSISPPFATNPADIPVPSSYPLYRHLHHQGYFMTPGLRFGCQYSAYPGDPVRFHAHFLCNGLEWDRPFDLIDLIGGGRLGTGVKKGFLLGAGVPSNAAPPAQEGHAATGNDGSDANKHHPAPSTGQDVRAFCIEWAGM